MMMGKRMELIAWSLLWGYTRKFNLLESTAAEQVFEIPWCC